MSNYGNTHINISWYNNNDIEQGYRVYKSQASIDINNLPEPLYEIQRHDYNDELLITYGDYDVIEDDEYYYIVECYTPTNSIFSEQKKLKAHTCESYVYFAYSNDGVYQINKLDTNRNLINTINLQTNTNINKLHVESLTHNIVYIHSYGTYQRIYKISPSGEQLWMYQPDEGISRLTIDHYGFIYTLTNEYIEKISPDGEPMFRIIHGYNYVSSKVEFDQKGNIYILGIERTQSFTVMKISPMGVIQTEYNIPFDISSASFVLDDSGNVYLIVRHDTTNEYHLMKIKEDNIIWDRIIPYTGQLLYHNGALFINASNGLHSRSAENGNENWSKMYYGYNFGDMSIDADGDIFISDRENSTVRKVDVDGITRWTYVHEQDVVNYSMNIAAYPNSTTVKHNFKF